MDVKQYYRKLREIEGAIVAPYVRVTSLETSDGGKRGVISEVTREQAARLMVEGRATLSSPEEEKSFFDKRVAEKKAFEKADMARRLHVTVVSASDEKEATASTPASAEIGVRK